MTTPERVAELHAHVFPDCPMSVLTSKLAEEAGEVCKEAVLSWEDTLRPRLTVGDMLHEVEDVITVCMILVSRLGGTWDHSVNTATNRFTTRFGG